VIHEERPFIIATDESAGGFLGLAAFMGLGVPWGPVKVDGQWTHGLRFLRLPESEGRRMSVELSEELWASQCEYI